MTLEEAKNNKRIEINSNYQKALNGLQTITSGDTTITLTNGIDLWSKLFILSRYAERHNLTNVTIRDYQSIQYNITIDTLNDILEQFEDIGIQIHSKKSSLFESIDSATTIEDVEGINW